MKIFRLILLLNIIAITLFATSCARHKLLVVSQSYPVLYEEEVIEVVEETEYIDRLIDVELYSQDPLFYAQDKNRLISEYEQEKAYQNMRRKFFRAWTGRPNTRSLIANHQSELDKFVNSPGFGENKLRRDAVFGAYLYDIAKIEGSPNTMKPAIMINYSHVRVMPTIKPFFRDFKLAGEGYPFDYWQNSTIPIGTPIFVLHELENWAFIDSHICSGWVMKNHFAYVDADLITLMMSKPLVAITRDKVGLHNIHGSYVGQADIGTILPLLSEDSNNYQILFVQKNHHHYAEITHINIPKNRSKKVPIPLTQPNIATLLSEMMNQTYGWGGMYFNRDCSQALLDLYIGFGILLPRNGRAQAYNFGSFFKMSDIPSYAERKRVMIERAIPFYTLVRTPGHIMLYVGSVDGEPLVFHHIWGLRTMTDDSKEGRFIIGRAVITSLEPGRGLPNINPDMTLIHRLEGITFFNR
jgi:hypothetical protein